MISASPSISHAGYDEAFLAYEKGDFNTAFGEFSALANQGNPLAQYNLGVMYEFGQGIAANDSQAVAWYRRAADQGDADAQHALGLMYEDGNGVARNDTLAAKWYRRAARQGIAEARTALARVEKYIADERNQKRLSIMRFQEQVSDANAPPERECRALKITSKLNYRSEKVSFDLERQPNYMSAGRPLGWYYASPKIRYEMKIRGDCLENLDFIIGVSPVIQLRSDFKKKSKQCGRKVVLEHERRHSTISKREFDKLAASMRKSAAELFIDKRVPDFEAVTAILDAKFDKNFFKDFRKNYDTAQEKFHTDLAERRIYYKNCKMTERKG